MDQSLSLFHKLLIFIENNDRVNWQDLNRFGQQRRMLGAMGRLEGLHYIERVKLDGEDNFVLTDKGDEILAQLLAFLPTNQIAWDGQWRIILFDIPESKRTVRQSFRLKLFDLGIRMLQSSVWITPFASAADQFEQYVRHHGSGHLTHFFAATHWGDNKIDVAHLWNLPALEAEYRSLFTLLRREQRRISQAPDRQFEAKCAIMSLALVAKKDPQLPSNLMPKNWIGYQAKDWYEKLRNYCN